MCVCEGFVWSVCVCGVCGVGGVCFVCVCNVSVLCVCVCVCVCSFVCCVNLWSVCV